ncbi:monocyte chemotactic protein 1B-like [Conger conger]|uniref:monocyte chemotactic protein 1B-like n=1 Tax=Conger conger TaxID=82655 RepID=UPI002A5A3FF4|nr:monocyte chemotactic protein 1B-like [Conger conger]
MSGSHKLVVLAVLVFGCLVLVSAYIRPTKFTTKCCKKAPPNKVTIEIISYERQNALGHCVDAIIFQTKKHVKFCAAPNAPWVQKKVKELDKKQ